MPWWIIDCRAPPPRATFSYRNSFLDSAYAYYHSTTIIISITVHPKQRVVHFIPMPDLASSTASGEGGNLIKLKNVCVCSQECAAFKNKKKLEGKSVNSPAWRDFFCWRENVHRTVCSVKKLISSVSEETSIRVLSEFYQRAAGCLKHTVIGRLPVIIVIILITSECNRWLTENNAKWQTRWEFFL